jgi:arylsulfatase A-like enzyme
VSRGQKLGYSLRNQQWRYGKWPDREELYDLKNDPDEKQNLAGNPEVEDRLNEFRALLEDKQKQATAGRRATTVR